MVFGPKGAFGGHFCACLFVTYVWQNFWPKQPDQISPNFRGCFVGAEDSFEARKIKLSQWGTPQGQI